MNEFIIVKKPVFVTEDKQVHATEEAAREHVMKAQVRGLVEDRLPLVNKGSVSEDDRGNEVIYFDVVPEFVASNSELLQNILNQVQDLTVKIKEV
jgi:hypothetical protein